MEWSQKINKNVIPVSIVFPVCSCFSGVNLQILPPKLRGQNDGTSFETAPIQFSKIDEYINQAPPPRLLFRGFL